MIFQLNLAAIAAVATQSAWKTAKPILMRDVVVLPALGFLGIILLWWVITLANHELMPTPPEALVAQGLTQEALAIKPLVKSSDLENPDLIVGYFPINDCAPFAIAWKKASFASMA